MKVDENTLELHPSDDTDTIKSALKKLPPDPYHASVFVHHSPVEIAYMAEKGADLVLSGHTHAGQVFPGTILSPVFFSFSRGLKQFGNTKVFVSQGRALI